MESVRRDPRGQGERGEMIAAMWFVEQGAKVYAPLLHTDPHVDFVADRDGALERIQVKTTTQHHAGRWTVSVRTMGGNRSWNRVVKKPDARRFDQLFAVVGDGRRWLIPSSEVDGRGSLTLGCERWAPWELLPGPALVTENASLD